ncbi:unnamed protein product, partial [Amoebophrya sp. A120]
RSTSRPANKRRSLSLDPTTEIRNRYEALSSLAEGGGDDEDEEDLEKKIDKIMSAADALQKRNPALTDAEAEDKAIMDQFEIDGIPFFADSLQMEPYTKRSEKEPAEGEHDETGAKLQQEEPLSPEAFAQRLKETKVAVVQKLVKEAIERGKVEGKVYAKIVAEAERRVYDLRGVSRPKGKPRAEDAEAIKGEIASLLNSAEEGSIMFSVGDVSGMKNAKTEVSIQIPALGIETLGKDFSSEEAMRRVAAQQHEGKLEHFAAMKAG